MTVEEKRRLDELRGQEELTEEEDGELQRLVALEKEVGTTSAVEISEDDDEEENDGDEVDTQG